jgi:hypothetical protein
MHNSRQVKESHPSRLRSAAGMAGLALWVLLWAGPALALTHAELQAVTSTGTSAWVESFPFTIRGVVLNDPEEMLDPAYDPEATAEGRFGGQFQIFIQAVDPMDRGGTALWMAQNYEALFWVPAGNDYGTGWTQEVNRVSADTNGRAFRKGDWVEVTAQQASFFNGKRNINEGHGIASEFNFDIRMVKANAGLPQAEALVLTNLVAADGSAIFDSTRETGGEHYQGMRVRLDGIRLADTNGWGKTNWADRVCLATDDTGRTLPLRMPLTDLGTPPSTSTWISAVGILNQEGGNTNGYELFLQELGPILSVGTHITGASTVSYSADYEGFVLEASDDGLSNWSEVDVTPMKVIVIQDDTVSSNRAYRLRKVD